MNEQELRAESAARGNFGDATAYIDGERRIIQHLVSAGYDVLTQENGYSVQRTGRQVAIFTLTDIGEFRWGWVEIPGGRIDHRNFADWLLELNTPRPAWAR